MMIPTSERLCRSHRALMTAEESLGESPDGTYLHLRSFADTLAHGLLSMASAAQMDEQYGHLEPGEDGIQ